MTRTTLTGLLAIAVTVFLTVEVDAVMARYHQPPWKSFLVSLSLALGLAALLAWGVGA